MPESVHGWSFDAETGVLRKGSWRHTRAHEYIFQLVKKMNYYCNQEAVREVAKRSGDIPGGDFTRGVDGGSKPGWGRNEVPSSRNPRSVLDVPTAPYKGAHYATFPPNLIAPLIRASCPKRCCPECGAPWAPVVEKARTEPTDNMGKLRKEKFENIDDATWVMPIRYETTSTVLDYRPTCKCFADIPSEQLNWDIQMGLDEYEPVPGWVLDPFIGSGTTGAVARELGRRWIGLDISMEYLDQQAKIRALNWTPSNALDELPLFMGHSDE